MDSRKKEPMAHKKESISIKINGTERHFDEQAGQEKLGEQRGQSSPEEWSIPQERPLTEDELEQVVRDTEYHQQEQLESRTNVELHQYHPFNRPRFNYRHLIYAVFLAILIGTSFGMLMKNIIITEKNVPAAVPVTNNENSNELNNPELNEVGSDGVIDENKLEIILPKEIIYVVQNGAFSTEESAAEHVNNLTSLQIPTLVLQADDKLNVHIALGSSLPNAKEVGELLADRRDIEVYAKEVLLKEQTIMVANDNEREFIDNLFPVLEQLIMYSNYLLLDNLLPEDWPDTLQTNFVPIRETAVDNEKLKLIQTELQQAAQLLLQTGQGHAASNGLTVDNFFTIQSHLLLAVEQYTKL